MNIRGLILSGFLISAGAAPAAVPWDDPAWTSRRAEATRELAGIQKSKEQKIGAVLQAAQKEWDTELAARKRTGNVRGIAVANSALDAIQRAQSALAATKPIEWPAPLRRELAEPIGKVRDTCATLEAEHAGQLQAARLKNLTQFIEAVRASDPDLVADDASAKALFERWLSGQPMKSAGPAKEKPSAGPVVGPAPEPAPGQPPPEFFAESGFGAQWATLGRWTADMVAPDVVSIPVFNQPSAQGSQMNPMAGRSSPWRYESQSTIPPGIYAFRLKRMEHHKPVQVMTWPKNEEGGSLTVRTPNAPEWPLRVGFEIQYARSGDMIEVPVRTDPAGATVIVNGEPYREGGEDRTTPCTLRLPEGRYDIRIRAEGYQDEGAERIEIRAGSKIAIRLKPSTSSKVSKVRVDARSSWARTGVTLQKGDRVHIAAEGEWSANGKDACGAGGYPNTLKYGHIYLEPRNSPRQIADRPYGMLLGRIGEGKPFAIGAQGTLTAPADGPLAFDINEITDEDKRSDNRGQLNVTLTVSRPVP